MKLMSLLLVGMIKAYQVLLSPFLGQNCRFYPTCSHYAHDCINKHGALIGSYYASRRLLRCHPWQAGGHDPIP